MQHAHGGQPENFFSWRQVSATLARIGGTPDKVIFFQREDLDAWVVLAVAFVVLFTLDMLFLSEWKKRMTIQSALKITMMWVACAACFGLYVFFRFGADAAWKWSSAYMLECQWKLKLLVAMQVIFAIGKFMVMDFVGGLLTFLIAGIGYYAVSNDMDFRWIMFWAIFGFMSAIYAIADFIRAFLVGDGFSAMMTGKAALIFNGIVILIGPFCFLCPVYYCYHIYQDISGTGGDSGSGRSGAYPGERQRLVGNAQRGAQQQNFQVFQGSGQKLGS